MTAGSGDRPKKIVHTATEIVRIRDAARLAADVLFEIGQLLQPGMTTLFLDELAGDLIRRKGAKSAFFQYRGFPGQLCISLNDEVVHGIGRPERVIRPGDLVSLDVGVRIDGGIGDTAATFSAGMPAAGEAKRLLEATRESLNCGIAQARAGRDVSEIGRAVEKSIKAAGFSVVRDFVGHGCGCSLHEPPEVPNFSQPARGPVLEPGMVLAIEPMVNAGAYRVTVDREDGWTVRTADGSLSAHFEHMVLITQAEPEILTCPRIPSEWKGL
jgi:methionyl aminopeptidase